VQAACAVVDWRHNGAAWSNPSPLAGRVADPALGRGGRVGCGATGAKTVVNDPFTRPG